jgi:hypothetical protein
VMGRGDETLRVESSSRGWRRFYAGFLTVLVVFVVVTFAVGDVHWMTQAAAVLVLVGQVPLAVQRFCYAEITSDGIHLDARVRRRTIPWENIEEIELGDAVRRAPRIGLTDGTDVKSHTLGGLVAGRDADPATLERLEREAETHGFDLRGR